MRSTGPFVLEDGTPVKLRTGRTISSAEARVGDTLDFEVLEEVRVGDVVVIPQGGIAWATVTEAEHKKRMGRGGKLNMNVDAVKLMNGQRAPLRAVQGGAGGGHVGAMTGAIVATAIVFWPAAPLFLFMHGKDLTVPKGTAVTAYINGNVPLDKGAFVPKTDAAQVATGGATTETVSITSVPPNADIEVDGSFVGSTPSSLTLAPGDHTITVTHKGFKKWERKVKTSSGTVNLNVELEVEAAP
ncbi:MAG: PEGA domain-containing protein [Candidatus Koribacter versatilis]|uniref:PEGA domain-containing protein n=1 Tax=Candidatus Korobacter versatilis TaxID=658062 RepID=A0A932A7V5_9BACT|nr:PEGA domain-containing protein [Candidatus Koribacter versatilis]